jgi:hypothetical protein
VSRAVLAAAALAALVLCPAAAAHGGGARGYVSTLERAEPSTAGLEVLDQRIHWMSPIAPPKVRAAPGDPHHVLD